MAAPSIGILGTGSLAAAIVTGLCDGVDDPPTVRLSPRNSAVAARLAAEFASVTVGASNQDVLDRSETILVCLREADATALHDLQWRPGHAVVSAVAGLGEQRLREAVAPAGEVARAVPMVAVATRAWRTPLRPATPNAVAVFERTGGALPVETDEQFDAIYTGLGTVAPFFDFLAAIERFLVAHGLAPAAARTLLAQSFSEVVAPLRSSSEPDFAALLREHAPAGGGNDQLATLMREAGVPEATLASLEEVFRRQTDGRWG